MVSAVFGGKAVASLFDGRWHKVVVAVQSHAVSVHLDCSSISSKPLGPRRALLPEGNAFLGLDAVRGSPVRVSGCGLGAALPAGSGPALTGPRVLAQFDIQQAQIYCDAELARQEGCCEISARGVSVSGCSWVLLSVPECPCVSPSAPEYPRVFLCVPGCPLTPPSAPECP